MRAYLTVLALSLLILSPFVMAARADLPDDATIQQQTVWPAVQWLVKQYNATVGLFHESPDTGVWNDTYWLYSDNYLARVAIGDLYAGRNVTISVLLNNDSSTASGYVYGQPDPVNQYMTFTTSEFAFNVSNPYTFGMVDGAIVKSTVNNGSGALSPLDYADVAFLQAIAYHQNGRDDYAMTVYDYGLKMWHGNGFNDTATHATYATYKLALYVFASKVLGQPIDSSVMEELLALQLHKGVDWGGFATSYTGEGHPASGANVETTSLCVMALLQSNPLTDPPTTSSELMARLFIVAAVLGSIALVVAIVVRRR